MLARFLSLALAVVTTCAVAQTYPVKPVRLLVPFPPGGSPEAFAEFLRQESEITGRLVRAHHIVAE